MLSNPESPKGKKKKLASVGTGSGKPTSVHSNEKSELSSTKGVGVENEMGEDMDKKKNRGVEVLCIMSSWNVRIAELIRLLELTQSRQNAFHVTNV